MLWKMGNLIRTIILQSFPRMQKKKKKRNKIMRKDDRYGI